VSDDETDVSLESDPGGDSERLCPGNQDDLMDGEGLLPYLRAMRWRTPLGGVLLLVGLVIYAALAATLGSNLPDNVLILTAYYLVAGIVWIWPAVWVIGWTKRDPGSDL